MQRLFTLGTAIGVGFVVGTRWPGGASLLSAFSVYLLLSLAQRVYLNSLIARADRARYALDGPVLQALTEKLWRFADPSSLAPRLRLHHALGWMMDEAWEKALLELSVDDGASLHPVDQAAWLGNRAFCLAQTGNFDGAMTNAHQALDIAQRMQEPGSIAAQQGIIGAVLLLRGEAAAALTYLEPSVAQNEGPKPLVALRQFFLGEAHHALGHAEVARAAWQAALDGGAPGSFAVKARERLQPS